jgi:hypothetical protein
MSAVSVGGSIRAQEPIVRETPAKEDDRKGNRRLKFDAKPLQGKKFYLDLPSVSSKKLQTLREDLELLGAEVSDFLSKDITHLVTNRKDAYQKENVASNVSMSTPSPFQKSSASASHPHSPWLFSPQETDSPNSCDLRKPLQPSYGKCSVQKALATSHQYQGSSNLIATALKFNVKIKSLDKVIDWIEQHKPEKQSTPAPPTANIKGKLRSITPSTSKVRCLKSPFIKVEDHSQKYKPLWLHMDHWPTINYGSNPGMSPFDMDSKSREKTQHRETTMANRQHFKPHRKRKGYCECCFQQFDDFHVHLKSLQHTEFASNPENYKQVDESIKQGVTFEEFLTKMGESEAQMHVICQTPNREEKSDHQESEDSVKLIDVSKTDEETKSSWDKDVHNFVEKQRTLQSCNKPNTRGNQALCAKIEAVAKEHVNQGNQPEVEAFQKTPHDPVSTCYKETDQTSDDQTSDDNTSGTFHGFTESDIKATISQAIPISQKVPHQRHSHQMEDFDHPQKKYLNQGLTTEEQELTISSLMTGKKNLRSRTASQLASKETHSPSSISVSRKRKQVILNEKTGSSMDFQVSPTWRQPAKRKHAIHKARFIV